ncbi:MAG: M50 family metallopeptidase [Candidatus Omnitrophica bacterium]|nr:M50 family metallopeptidase [Candidatus Omnitrophota bacterium]MCM8831269.1 M50 family metallopeptidase [Candidatus Omnitrophota bacterium]
MNILIFILIVSILIVVHELGHFIAAYKEGVRVEKFAIGFGPVLFKKKGKITDFLICLFPFGGYVKLAGDSQAEFKGLDYEFLSKSPIKRIKIVFAGPFFNYIFAFIIFWIIAMVGLPYIEPVIGNLLDGYPAKMAGLKENDRILKVNGKKIESWSSMANLIYKSKEKVTVEVKREDKILQFEIPLAKKNIEDDFGKKRTVSVIGISASPTAFKLKRYNFFIAFLKAGQVVINLTFLLIKGIFFIILGIIPFREAMAGPLGIYYITSEATKLGIVAVLYHIANLSLSLAVINLFPLPILDGGHIFLFLLEKIRKKQLNERIESIITNLSVALIVILFVFIFYNDIIRFGSKIFSKN